MQPNHQKLPLKKEQKLPINAMQALSEKLIPLVFMVALYGLLQVLASFYAPSDMLATGHYKSYIEEEIPFSILVRSRRIGLGLSRGQVAQKVNLSIKNIKAIEQGDATPTKRVEFEMRTVLGLKVKVVQDLEELALSH